MGTTRETLAREICLREEAELELYILQSSALNGTDAMGVDENANRVSVEGEGLEGDSGKL